MKLNKRLASLVIGLGACGAAAGAGGCAASVSPDAQICDATPGQVEVLSAEEIDRQYDAACAVGVACAEKGAYSPAMQAFERALSLKPSSTEALFNLGACYEALGDPARAVTIYRRVLEITPNDPDCYANLGTSFIKMYHREKSPIWRKMARDSWKRALELNPRQPRIKSYLARTESLDG